jgi:hypothetical protein
VNGALLGASWYGLSGDCRRGLPGIRTGLSLLALLWIIRMPGANAGYWFCGPVSLESVFLPGSDRLGALTPRVGKQRLRVGGFFVKGKV